MRVFVIDDRIRMRFAHVQTKQDIVFVWSPQKKSTEVKHSFGQVSGWFEVTEVFLIFGRDDHDWRGGVNLHARKSGMEHGAHAFELIRHLFHVFLAGIADHNEVWAAHLQPSLWFCVAARSQSKKQQEWQCQATQHMQKL